MTDQVDTGDILLFRSHAFMSKMQRVVTGSQYDHVGLLLRYSSGKIVVFESLNETGVGIVDWQKFKALKWHHLYDKIVYRKLQFPRDESFLELLDDFVRQTVGKKFNMNPLKLL